LASRKKEKTGAGKPAAPFFHFAILLFSFVIPRSESDEEPAFPRFRQTTDSSASAEPSVEMTITQALVPNRVPLCANLLTFCLSQFEKCSYIEKAQRFLGDN
jgi:hypothetical protein